MDGDRRSSPTPGPGNVGTETEPREAVRATLLPTVPDWDRRRLVSRSASFFNKEWGREPGQGAGLPKVPAKHPGTKSHALRCQAGAAEAHQPRRHTDPQPRTKVGVWPRKPQPWGQVTGHLPSWQTKAHITRHPDTQEPGSPPPGARSYVCWAAPLGPGGQSELAEQHHPRPRSG